MFLIFFYHTILLHFSFYYLYKFLPLLPLFSNEILSNSGIKFFFFKKKISSFTKKFLKIKNFFSSHMHKPFPLLTLNLKNFSPIRLNYDYLNYLNFFSFFDFSFNFFKAKNFFIIGSLISPYDWQFENKKKWFKKKILTKLEFKNFKKINKNKINHNDLFFKTLFFSNFHYLSSLRLKFTDFKYYFKITNLKIKIKNDTILFSNKPYSILQIFRNSLFNWNPYVLILHFFFKQHQKLFFRTYRNFKNTKLKHFKKSLISNMFVKNINNVSVPLSFIRPYPKTPQLKKSFLNKNFFYFSHSNLSINATNFKKLKYFENLFFFFNLHLYKNNVILFSFWRNSLRNSMKRSLLIFFKKMKRNHFFFFKKKKLKRKTKLYKLFFFTFFSSQKLTKRNFCNPYLFFYNFYKSYILNNETFLPYSLSFFLKNFNFKFYKFKYFTFNHNILNLNLKSNLDFTNDLRYHNKLLIFKLPFVKSKHNTFFISSQLGFLYLSSYLSNVFFEKFYSYNIKKKYFAFPLRNETQRFIIKHYLKIFYHNSLPELHSSRRFNLRSSLDNVFADINSNFLNFSSKINDSSSFFNNFIARSDAHILDSFDNLKINEKTNSSFFIKKIKFKPGYMTFWREARQVFKEILNLSFKYQYKLTRYIFKYNKILKFNLFLSTEMGLKNILVRSRFFFDWATADYFIKNGLIFINGFNCSNLNFQLFIGDLIQLLISLKYYILYRWFSHWINRKKLKLKIKTKKKLTFIMSEEDKIKTRTYPKWILSNRNITDDIAKYMEVDFLTLSIFIVYEPFKWEDLNIYSTLWTRFSVINMYNWKYIT